MGEGMSLQPGAQRPRPMVLPPELVYVVGQQLFEASSRSNNDLPWSDCSPFLSNDTARHTRWSRMYAPKEAWKSLLALSSASKQMRNLLAPLVWYELTLKRPSDTVFLRTLAQRYAKAGQQQQQQAADFSSDSSVQLCRPLAYASSLRIAFSSDRYPGGVEQSTLLDLISAHSLGARGPLRALHWSAETLPIPSLWPLLAGSLELLEVDCKTFWAGHKNLAKLTHLSALKLTAYDAMLLPEHLPKLLLALTYSVVEHDRDREDEADGGSAHAQHPAANERSTLQLTFSPTAEERHEQERSIQRAIASTAAAPEHGQDTASGGSGLPTASGPDREVEASFAAVEAAASTVGPMAALEISESKATDQTMEQTAPLTPERRASHLLHLSMSTSKTSLLHSTTLIAAGAFSSLVTLDIYPVTPEPPLDAALRSCGATLRQLKLALDISGAFRHYDELWRALTGHMHALQQLDIDPHPQQNTAPRFGAFVRACKSLRTVNGRNVDGDAGPPDLGDFDPDHRTGAIFY